MFITRKFVQKYISINIIFMIVTGKEKNKLVLNILSAISRLGRNKAMLSEIGRMKSPERLVKLIEIEDIEVGKAFVAGDLIEEVVIPIDPEMLLEEAGRRMMDEIRNAFPVVDKAGNFIGELSNVDILKAGIPGYASYMNDLGFMRDDDIFEEYLKKEKKLKVKEFCNTNVPIVDRRAPVIEVSFLMTKSKSQSVYVVEKGKYIGEIYARDVFKKVFYL